jgi:sugar lactone lactonase YvrE
MLNKLTEFALVLTSLAALTGGVVHSQSVEPNSQPNPYRLVLNWAQLPSAMKWGQVIAFDFDRDGDVYVFHRNDPGILRFSPSGKLLKSWGTGMFVMPHSVTVDRFGNIWASDADVKEGKGGQVFKFDKDGNVLLTLGKAGVRAEGRDTFVAPTWAVVAGNGDVFVSDGHGQPRDGLNHRIVKFSKDGTFIKAWGKTGAGPGELNDPHGLALDSQGRIFVADRGNKRVQIFDQDGRYLAEWKQFSTPENIYITRDDTLYVSDSNSSATNNPPYKRGIRVGSAKDGTVRYFIPEESYDPTQAVTSGPVGLGVDAQGNIYAADVGTTVGFDRMVKKYIVK